MSPDVDGELLDELHEILRERYYQRTEGDIETVREQAITSGEMADRVTDEDTEANPQTREAVKVLMRERGLPVIGSNHGYYIPVDPNAIESEIDALEGRIDGIRERQQLLRDNWDNWQRRQHTFEDVEADETDDSDATVADGGPEELTDQEREFVENNPISADELLATRRGGDA